MPLRIILVLALLAIAYTSSTPHIHGVLAAAFFIASSISTFDKRLIQAKRAGDLPPDQPVLPNWIVLIDVFRYGAIVALAVLDWKFGLALYIMGFFLAVLPVLEMVGNFLVAPLRPRE